MRFNLHHPQLHLKGQPSAGTKGGHAVELLK